LAFTERSAIVNSNKSKWISSFHRFSWHDLLTVFTSKLKIIWRQFFWSICTAKPNFWYICIANFTDMQGVNICVNACTCNDTFDLQLQVIVAFSWRITHAFGRFSCHVSFIQNSTLVRLGEQLLKKVNSNSLQENVYRLYCTVVNDTAYFRATVH